MANKSHYSADDAYRFIVAYKRAYGGQAPTMRKIQTAVGAGSVSVVDVLLNELQSRGWIRRMGRRGIVLAGERWEVDPPSDVPARLVE